MAFDDILFDAKKLVKAIQPAAWGQGFSGDRRGAGISLSRVIDCMIDARVTPDPAEGYVQEPPITILHQLAILTTDPHDRASCKNGAEIRARLADVIEQNTSHFSRGEQVLLRTLADLPDDNQKLRFYLVFHDDLDRLLQRATGSAPPNAPMPLPVPERDGIPYKNSVLPDTATSGRNGDGKGAAADPICECGHPRSDHHYPHCNAIVNGHGCECMLFAVPKRVKEEGE